MDIRSADRTFEALTLPNVAAWVAPFDYNTLDAGLK